MSEHIRVTTADHLCRIRIDRPERKNAFTHEMYRAVVAAMEAAEADPSVRAIVFEGSEEIFTSGNDLQDFMQSPPTGHDAPVFRFLLALIAADKPLVAAIRGPAVGIGTTMLLHCDLVYADERAVFEMPFVKLALCPEGGSSLLLPRMMGLQRASELLLLSERFGAERARELGLVNRVFTREAFTACVEAQLGRLVSMAPQSVRLAKQLMREGLREEIRAAMEKEGTLFIERLGSAEAREAFTAFFEKRKPDFSKVEGEP